MLNSTPSPPPPPLCFAISFGLGIVSHKLLFSIRPESRTDIDFINRVFNLEKSYSLWPECPDYVIVRDGINSWSKMLKSLCGGETGWEEEIVSSGNVMRVEFNTDRERSAPGFTAEYTSMISKGNVKDLYYYINNNIIIITIIIMAVQMCGCHE